MFWLRECSLTPPPHPTACLSIPTIGSGKTYTLEGRGGGGGVFALLADALYDELYKKGAEMGRKNAQGRRGGSNSRALEFAIEASALEVGLNPNSKP